MRLTTCFTVSRFLAARILADRVNVREKLGAKILAGLVKHARYRAVPAFTNFALTRFVPSALYRTQNKPGQRSLHWRRRIATQAAFAF